MITHMLFSGDECRQNSRRFGRRNVSQMISISVRYFGPSADAAGREREERSLPAGSTLAALSEAIYGEYPALRKAARSIRFAVNQEYANDDVPLSDGDEVAVIPPVAGGAGDDADAAAGDSAAHGSGDPVHVAMQEARIDPAALERFVASHEAGAIATFLGTVRGERGGAGGADDELLALEYTAYGEMALKKMRAICEAARAKHDLIAVAAVHRTGRLELGEASIAVAVSSGHRAEAFAGCRYVIDTLKVEVPIWKKEHWSSGETSWVDPTAPAQKGAPDA